MKTTTVVDLPLVLAAVLDQTALFLAVALTVTLMSDPPLHQTLPVDRAMAAQTATLQDARAIQTAEVGEVATRNNAVNDDCRTLEASQMNVRGYDASFDEDFCQSPPPGEPTAIKGSSLIRSIVYEKCKYD